MVSRQIPCWLSSAKSVAVNLFDDAGVLTAIEDFVAQREQVRLVVIPTFFGLGIAWHTARPYSEILAALRREPPDQARAEACFLEAIEVARSQDARLLELRAATDLARLWQGTRTAEQIRALIEPALAAIEGGETAPDVRNARELLSRLL